ncbi:MAG: S-4TM family putative pore-forming effector, partial [Acetobacteraceae bacterium]
RYYDHGQFWHRLRVAGTTGFAALGVVVTFRYHGAADYVAAAAGAWLLFARTLFDWRERQAFACAAKAQEQCDCQLFSIPWNQGLAGYRLSAEDIASVARGYDRSKVRDWYPADADRADWPRNAILCQRSSAAWGRRTHKAYAGVVGAGAGLWLLATVIIGAAAHASLAEYLIRLFLPSQPALMDSVDLIRTHSSIAARRLRVEQRAEDLATNENATEADCRGLQDQMFEIRHKPPRVPNWFYRLRRKRDEQAMNDAARVLAARLPT